MNKITRVLEVETIWEKFLNLWVF